MKKNRRILRELFISFVVLCFSTPSMAQDLPIRKSRDLVVQNGLLTPFSPSNSSTLKDTISLANGLNFPADVTIGFTVEVDAKVKSSEGRGLSVFACSKNSKGAILDISKNGMFDFGKSKVLAKNLNGNADSNTYRMAVTSGNVWFYRNGICVGKNITHSFPKASSTLSSVNVFPDPSFEAVQVATTAGGGGVPSGEWGCYPAGRFGMSYNSRVASDGWGIDGSNVLFLRMRNTGNVNEAAGAAEAVSSLESISIRLLYYKATGLKENTSYQFKFKYKGHNLFQKTVSVFASSKISDALTNSDAIGTVATIEPEATGSTGATSATKEASMTFTVPSGKTEVYIVFKRNGNANYYLDAFELKEVIQNLTPEQADLSIGKFDTGLADMTVTALRYDLTGAYAPESIADSACGNPLYTDKTNLIPDPSFNQGFSTSKEYSYSTSMGIFTGSGAIAINTDPNNAYCGTTSGKIDAGTGSIELPLSLNPFTKYRIKAIVKTMDGDFQFGVTKYDLTKADISQVVNTNGVWKAVDFEFNTGSNASGALAYFNNTNLAGKSAYIDNLELYNLGVRENAGFIITSNAISEANIKATIREMLAKHLPYAESNYKSGGYFGTGNSDEHGARTNADYALIYSFLYKYAQNQAFPNGISIETVKQHALAAIRYSYNTHKTGTVNCANGSKWGLIWESSLWSTSVAYASWLMWNDLTAADKAAIKTMVLAEANFNLSRTIPTAVNSDTKAEENAWDTNILAIAASMFPEEKNAQAWTLKCKQFATNTYSTASDLYNTDTIDGKEVNDWHIGANLFPDYALENHDFFHTSYLNIPIQEMSESLLAYKAVQNQTAPVFPIPSALKHNVPNVWNSLLKELVMADGELAMPNGNDWSMYIYDQLASYSAMACIYKDPDALMLESITLQYAKMRQSTTTDGAFMLKPDVAERRMAVTGRRLVFSYLYHEYFSTNDIVATKWADFSQKHEATKLLPYSRIIRGNSPDRFVTFSWFQSINGSYKSYMGMVSPNLVDKSNIVFPLKVANTGNLTGYVDVTGKARNASLVGETYLTYPKSFTTTGKLNVNASSLSQYIACYSTPGNALIYMDELVGNVAGTLTKDGGLMLGITTDIIAKESRTLYSQTGAITSDGGSVSLISGNWVNVDDVLGMVVNGGNGIAFGEKEEKTSIMVSKLYGSYSTAAKTFAIGDILTSRSATIYSRVNNQTTRDLASKAKYPTVATGWKAAAVEDPDGRRYLLMANFRSSTTSNVTLSYPQGAPVFDRLTTIVDSTGSATFNNSANVSTPQELYTFVKTGSMPIQAVQGESPYSVYVKNGNLSEAPVTISIWKNNTYSTIQTILQPNESKFVRYIDNSLVADITEFPGSYRNIARGKSISADSQWPEHFPFATIDEEDSTYYQSLLLPTAATPQNLTINLYGLHTCNKVTLKAVAGIGPNEVVLQTSTDGVMYSTVKTTTLSNTTDIQSIDFAETDAKYVRLKINSTFGEKNVGIATIQLFGFPK